MRAAADERLNVLASIVDDENARAADRIAAFSALLRYGLGASDEVTATVEAKHPEAELIALVRAELVREVERLGPEEFARRLAQEIEVPADA